MTANWILDRKDQAELTTELHQRLAAFLQQPNKAMAFELCAAVGRCSYAGLEALVVEASKKTSAEQQKILAQVEIDWDALDHQAIELCRLLPELSDDCEPSLLRRVRELLQVREAIEFTLEGTRQLGQPLELSVMQEATLLSFDEELAEHQFRLTVLADVASERLQRLAPAHRERFWWWNGLRDFEKDALTALATAARLICRFPDAREELERLIQAETDLQELAKMAPAVTRPSTGKVVSLADYIRQRAARRSADEEGLAVACADEEMTFYQQADLALSANDDELLLDIDEQSILPTEPPRLMAEGKEPLIGEQIYPGRYRFLLNAEQFATERASIELSIGERSVQIALPLEGDAK